MTDIDLKKLCWASPAYWAEYNMVRLQSGVFRCSDGSGHEFQQAVMDSQARRLAIRKGTQSGGTEAMILMALHGMIHGMFPRGVMYLFPTQDDVEDFSRSRFGPMISANPESIGQYVKQGGKGTDTTGLKKIGDAFLYLRGTRQTQRVGVDMKESAKSRSAPADMCVFDEFDLTDEDAAAAFIQRMGHSEKQWERYLSNPTLPGIGIDDKFSQGDQRYWFSYCGACGRYTSSDLEFPGCVKRRLDGKGYVACRSCGRPVDHRLGRWEAQAPQNTAFMESYHVSQLTSPYNDPAEIRDQFENPPGGNLEGVKKYRLGLPHVSAENKLDSIAVRRCMGAEGMVDRHDGPCAMGVDMGAAEGAGQGKPVVIGIKTSRETWEVVRVARVRSMGDVHDLARRFNVRSGVIDIRPLTDEARTFARSQGYPVFLCQYADNWGQEPDFDEGTWTVKADRTQMCDRTHRCFTEEKIRLPRRCPEMDVFVDQVCNVAKVLEVNERTGAKVYRYRHAGPKAIGDHYRHALNYFLLAAQRVAVARETVWGQRQEAQFALHDE